MSNTDIIKASYAAFGRGDIDAAMEIFAPDIEWRHPDGMADYGLGGVEAFMGRSRTVFSELRPTFEEFVEDGDRVVVFGTHHMRGAKSGVSGTVRFVHAWRLADGRATHFEDFHDTADVRRIVEGDGAGG
jgi:ketosteroid isomerase-like protein